MPSHTPREKVRKVLREFKEGRLRSSSGAPVTNRKQAIAIALSEAGLSKKLRQRARSLSSRKR